MTPRERIQALIKRLRDDAERDHDLGIKLLEKASEELVSAAALAEVLPSLSDRLCEEAVKSWGDEKKAS